MKSTLKTIALAAGVLTLGLNMQAKSAKRGVSEGTFSLNQQMELIAPGCVWYYNWANTPANGYHDEVINSKALEFVPMVWNGSYSPTRIREYCAAHPETKYLLGFNEPNFYKQARMTPAEAAAKWGDVQALAKELGLKLVAPALNYSPDAPYQDPLKWMDEFVAIVGLDAFDYVAIHNYGGLGVLQTIANNFHDKYGKEVWLTEFCLWPDEGNPNSTVAPATQVASMIETLTWLEKTPWIFRYAWFKPIGACSADTGPNYGLIVPMNGLGDRELSLQGYNYVYFPDLDPDVFQPVNTVIAANQFVNQNNITLDKGANPACPQPVEIAQFNSGAYLDYQFDVPESGEYTLKLTVTGQGEPTRFDPCVAVYSVTPEGSRGKLLSKQQQFSLPGNFTDYQTQEFPMTLEAGRQTIRLMDAYKYQPSGIHISTIELTKGAGVEAAIIDDADAGMVDVYNLQGVKLRSQQNKADALMGLPKGVYIVGGRKMAVR